MVNKVILIGNLGRDPEMRSTQSGQPVANFSIATNRRWNDRQGNRQEETEWHNIVCFGRQAEVAGQYLRKGKQIYVEGRIQTRSWDDRQTGEKKYRTEIVCENFQMLGQRGDSGGGGGYGGEGWNQGRSSQGRSDQGTGGGPDDGPDGGDYGPPGDDDIPF
jgi:single-strand DNA-binding protein